MFNLLKKYLRLPPLNRIVTQFIFSHVFLASGSIALVGLFLLTETNSFVRQSVNEKNIDKAITIKSEIVSFVNNSFSILSFATEFPDIYSMEKFRQELTLNSLLVKYDYYRNLFVADSTGAIVASTVLGERLSAEFDTERYTGLQQDEQSVSPVYIKENEPRITVTTPIRQFDRFTGFLIAELSVNFIWDLVDELSREIPGGLVYILDDKGTVIAHPNRRAVYGQHNYSDLLFVQNLTGGEEGIGSFINPEGERTICAYAPVQELHWGVVVSQPESVAFEIFRDILTRLIIIIVASTILASLLAVVITRNLVSPLNSLVMSVKRVQEGSLPSRVKVPKTEELATLATEFNRMTENLEKVQKKLQKAERLATMSKFASVVAHEIRNPFNSIVINMQILKRGMVRRQSPEHLEKFMEIIDSEIRRVDTLIKNYLSLSKPPEFNPVSSDINVLLDELIILLHARAVKQGIRIEHTYDRESMKITIDENQIKQACLNIMLNAFEAMPEGGTLTVALLLDHKNEKHPNTLKLAFTDTGTGIPADKITDVFDYFYTLKKGGTGLGLAVTRQIIQGHDGFIEIERSSDEGTTVSIYLPISTSTALS